MRTKSVVLAGAFAMLAAAPAWSQPADWYFQQSVPVFAPQAGSFSGPGVRLVPPPKDIAVDNPIRPPAFAPTRGANAWRADEVTFGGGKTIDTMRVSVREGRVGPAVGIVSGAPYDNDAVAVSYTRGWPAAMKLNAGRYNLALSPHAGFGVSNLGTTAEAGAMVKLSPGAKSAEDRLSDLGVSDGAKYGEEGRWYLFAAASGRAVGLNMTRAGGGWSQSGWSTDKTSKLVGDGQLGLGYRKGAMQASVGYVYREIKVQNGPLGADTDVSDSMAAFSLSIRPNF